MFEFIRIQYLMGKLTKEQVSALIGEYISQKEANQILGVE